jgi:hypothetical protein
LVRLGRVVGIVGVATLALLAASGLAILTAQVAQWLDTGWWSEFSLLELFNTPLIKSALPVSFSSWLSRPRSLFGLHAAVGWLFETVPAWLFLDGVAGAILWRALAR